MRSIRKILVKYTRCAAAALCCLPPESRCQPLPFFHERANMKFAASSLLVLICITFADAQEAKVRLFILSGQSNMAGLKPETSFTPAIKKAFPKDEARLPCHLR